MGNETGFAFVPECPLCDGLGHVHAVPFPKRTDPNYYRLLMVYINSETPCPDCAPESARALKCVHCGREVSEAEVIEQRLRLPSGLEVIRAMKVTPEGVEFDKISPSSFPVVCATCAVPAPPREDA